MKNSILKTGIIVSLLCSVTSASSLKKEDRSYFDFLIKKLSALKEDEPQKLLLNYIKYLESNDKNDSTSYVEGLKNYWSRHGARIPKISIFEGDRDLCEIDSGTCIKSVGSLTKIYLAPRIKMGDFNALELVYIHTAVANSDGAEAEQTDGIINQTKMISKFKKTFDKIKSRHSKFLNQVGGNTRITY